MTTQTGDNMSKQNYELEIISHHPKFEGKMLKKYHVDGIDTIGAWGDETFSVVFKNNTSQKVQVKLSIDGTDILTGKLASTDLSNQMWVVDRYSSLKLDAYPETNNGGAAFIFTSADNSVAVHTHGDLSSRGIIAAAVYTEGAVEPVRLNRSDVYHHYDYRPYYDYGPNHTPIVPITYPGYYWTSYNTSGSNILRSTSVSSTFSGQQPQAASYNSTKIENNLSVSDGVASKSLENLVAVGAGQYVEQNISYVAGLVMPLFSETVRVKFLWWDDLVAKLRTETPVQEQPSGFPADKKNIDLKNTPRLGKKKASKQKVQPVFDRF